MLQLEHNRVIERNLWTAADNLHSDSNYTSQKYFQPLMDLVFLRYTDKRLLSSTIPYEQGMVA